MSKQKWYFDDDGRECTLCGKYLPWSEFSAKHAGCVKGRKPQCNTCRKEKYQKNKVEISAQAKEYYKRNAERIKAKENKRRTENPERYKKMKKASEDKRRERVRAQKRASYKRHRKTRLAQMQRWVDNNRDHVNAYKNEWLKQKTLNNGPFQLSRSISSGMGASLRKRGGSKRRKRWETLVGYTIEELMQHLEKQFKDGMSWDNYGKEGWHVDHILPIASFEYNSPDDDEFKKCWALENLQPLWWWENMSKGAKLDWAA